VQEVLCLAAGGIVGFAASWLASRWRARRTTPVSEATAALPPAPAATPAPDTVAGLGARTLVAAIADELADLASGIEGNAHLLIEAAARPGKRTDGADPLWSAVQRLNRLQWRLRALAVPPPADGGPTDAAEVLADVRSWLQTVHFGLTVELELPESLPPVRANRRVLEDALVSAAECLLLMERGATRLALSAQFEGDGPEVAIALDLEWIEEPAEGLPFDRRSEVQELECAAAHHLILSQGGSLEVLHMANHHFAQAVVRLPASSMPAGCEPVLAPPRVADRVPQERHRYGGVLLLEPDPAIRSMLAAELKARGRNVFACADGDAVRVLLETTPDRFELLIVDQRMRPEPAHQLAESSARLCPGLKVCLLAGEATDEPPDDLRHRLHLLPKPFGVRDLRLMLEDLLPR
jgi:hypothetical protein